MLGQIIDLRKPSLINALSFDHQVYFWMNIFGKRSALPFFRRERSQKGEKRGFYACNQTQLDDFVHKQTIICSQLFAGHIMVGFWPMKKKNNLHGSHILPVFFFRISNQAQLSQMKHLKNWRTAFVVLLHQLVLYSLLTMFFLLCTCCGGHAWSAGIKAMFLKGIYVTYWHRVCQSFRLFDIFMIYRGAIAGIDPS